MTIKIDLRDRLIALTIAELEAGNAEPSLREIARKAGVSAMAPYRHFSDKAGLLTAVVTSGFRQLQESLELADQSTGGREALIAQGLAYIAFARANPALFHLMFTHAKAGDTGSDPHDLSEAEGYNVLRRRLAQTTGFDEKVAAPGCWALVHGLAVLQRDRKLDLARDELCQILDVMTCGLEPSKN